MKVWEATHGAWRPLNGQTTRLGLQLLKALVPPGPSLTRRLGSCLKLRRGWLLAEGNGIVLWSAMVAHVFVAGGMESSASL